jgi:formiminotetrahydrofolate cyclodeaminase
MVGQLSYGKRQFESVDGTMRQLIPILHKAMNNFLPLTDADTAAFNQYMVLTPRDGTDIPLGFSLDTNCGINIGSTR